MKSNVSDIVNFYYCFYNKNVLHLMFLLTGLIFITLQNLIPLLSERAWTTRSFFIVLNTLFNGERSFFMGKRSFFNVKKPTYHYERL